MGPIRGSSLDFVCSYVSVLFLLLSPRLVSSQYNRDLYVCFFNPFYTGRVFHCYMLDESTCHFRDIGPLLSL